MNREFSPGKLRKVAQRLKRIPFDTSSYYNVTAAPQEALDFLAMLGGLKPVYTLGRGFDDLSWVTGIRAQSVDLGLFVIDGPPFLPLPEGGALPDWFREIAEAREMRHAVSYITRVEALAEEAMLRSQSGRIGADAEAKLFGYPECCVREYHAKQRRVTETEFAIALRACGGDESRLRGKLGGPLEIRAETEAEAAALQPHWAMAPFTSFFLCAACEADPASPGWALSGRMERFLRKIDPELHTVLSKVVRESPVYARSGAGD